MSGITPIAPSSAPTVFKVRCQSTRPGEAVFVVGGHEALGSWSTAMALPLTTSADTFPEWQSSAIPLIAGMMVEYKFVIQREDRQGSPQWQNFQGNYRVTPVAGKLIQAASDWDKAFAEITTSLPETVQTRAEGKAKGTKGTQRSEGTGIGDKAEADKVEPADVASEDKAADKATIDKAAADKAAADKAAADKAAADKAAAKHEKEEILLKMAESSVDKAAAEVASDCPLAVTLADRPMSRRNFSQSLMTLDVDDIPGTGTQGTPSTPGTQGTKGTQGTQGTQDTKGTQGTQGTGDEAAKASPKMSPKEDASPRKSPKAEAQDVESKDREEPAKTESTEVPEGDASQTPNEIEEPLKVPEEPERRGVSLRHITSFSALAEIAPAEAKAEHRKGKKVAQSHYDPYNLNVPVVVVTSEVAPFSKTGGLGMVAASYGFEFARNGHRTMVVAPKYKHYEGLRYIGETRVRVNDQEENVKYFYLRKDLEEGKGTDFLFIEGRGIERDGGLYNDNDGCEYPDNLHRFTLLCLAAMEAPLVLDINGQGRYGDKVTFLANDWQAGLVPVYMCYKYRRHNCYSQARVIYVIHNLGYQGQYYGYDACRFLGLDEKAAFDLVLGNCINLSKGALICADRVITVSPNYSKEIQTSAGGFNLQDFVSAKAASLRLAGILNGIDDCWDPLEDADIAANFSVENFEQGKAENKAHLQKLLGLEVNPDLCMIGFVGRLTWQKGIDVLASVISWLMQDTGNGVTGHVQLILMGNGEKQYSEALRWAETSYKGRVCGYVGFDPKVEHQMMAGCDLLLMPSRYEPCGLPQMYSQMYGTLPVVHATGGLVDSVKDISSGVQSATGFLVQPLSSDKLKEMLFQAVELNLKRKEDFHTMQRSAMPGLRERVQRLADWQTGRRRLSDYYWPKAMDEYDPVSVHLSSGILSRLCTGGAADRCRAL
ncbi:unnamed protein product [Effrenium voratum]|nr:unnamed protein product [Effrenium voratum]